MTSKYASGTSVICMEHLNNGVSQVPLQTFEFDHISPTSHALHDSHYNTRWEPRAFLAFLFLSVSPLAKHQVEAFITFFMESHFLYRIFSEITVW